MNGRSRSISPEYQSTCLDKRSRSPSPHLTPTETEYYGTTQLEQRSRSPSPSSAHSFPVQRLRVSRPGGRRLPLTPSKPLSLRLNAQSVEGINFPSLSHSPTIPQPTRSPNAINFPKVNASPTHTPNNQLPSTVVTTPRIWKSESPTDKEFIVSPAALSTLQPPSTRGGRVSSASSAKAPRELPQPPQIATAPHSLPYISVATVGDAEPEYFYETAATMSRGARLLPSPLTNGHKTAQHTATRRKEAVTAIAVRRPQTVSGPSAAAAHISVPESDDDDDDDWC
ncbi:voltage-dependent calcium channel type A subunit alpha-1-like protein [Leptotrombidium deliense]|uniref:Voltage-dependent calcium channel type A subunit alpha-1-like protein n=1 Tax=Leptotrombidium deliense TaxID=299467 RepID=A0A443SPQ8_9ACAR|nr:voltage-dependent calcium channel type A subunit alpha-1-like protein [Leptotrombidium deliense]